MLALCVGERLIERRQVTGHGSNVGIGQRAQFFDHVPHRSGGDAMLLGVALAQVAVQLSGIPGYGRTRQSGQRRRFPAVDHRTCQIGLATLLCPERIARCMTRAAVAQAVDQVVAAIPLGGLRSVNLDGRGVMKQAVPQRHQRANVVRKSQSRLRRDGLDRRLRHQVGVQRRQVFIRRFGIRRVRESWVQVMPIA